MTPEEIQARLDEIRGRLKEIDTEYAGQALPDAQRDEFKSLVGERKELERLGEELTARRAQVEEAAREEASREAGSFQVRKDRVRGDDIYDLSTVRASVNSPESAERELKERAKYAVEQGQYAADGVSREEAQSNVERLLAKVDRRGILARRVLETGSPTYMRAFGKKLNDAPLTDTETRALSTSNTGGGFAIPFTLDPSVILTSNHSVNPYRAISRVVQVVTDNWNGVSSAGVTASYAAEGSEAGDDSPTLAQPSIDVEKAHVFIPYSIEIGQDWSGLQSEMTGMIQEAKDDLEATKFTLGAGSGSDEPQGVLVGGTTTLDTAGSATFAVADLYSTEETLPPRYRPRAQWVTERSIYNLVRQFDTTGGAQLWTENLQRGLENNVPTPGNTGYNLLGYPANECSAINAGTAAGSTVLVFGDFSRYVIVDRVGMSVELIPHLFGTANNRPTGQRGLYANWRNSAEVVDPNAFRKLLAGTA